MNMLAKRYNDLQELFFPSLCITCGNRLVLQEKFLCLHCWHDMPLTGFDKDHENKVAQLFWGRTNILNATAFIGYNKGSHYRHLLHYIKYKGLKELGFEVGRRFGIVLADSPLFAGIDVLAPVPLHPKKQKIEYINRISVKL